MTENGDWESHSPNCPLNRIQPIGWNTGSDSRKFVNFSISEISEKEMLLTGDIYILLELFFTFGRLKKIIFINSFIKFIIINFSYSRHLGATLAPHKLVGEGRLLGKGR